MELRNLAKIARDKRGGMRSPEKASNNEDSKEVAERDELRKQRHADRARERNIARAAPGKQYVSSFLYLRTVYFFL